MSAGIRLHTNSPGMRRTPELQEIGLTSHSAALQPLSGKIYTSYNTKVSNLEFELSVEARSLANREQWAYLFFFGLFELGSLICGLARSSSMLIGGRAIAGMGSSGLLNGGMTIIAGAVPLDKRPSTCLKNTFYAA
jgi:MFS family permease